MRRPATPFRHFRPLFLFGAIGFCLWVAIRALRALACHALLARNAKAVCTVTLPKIVTQLPLIFVCIGVLCVVWSFYRSRE